MKRNPFERDLPPGAAPSEPLSLLEPLPPVVTTHTAPAPSPGMESLPQPAASPPLPPLEVTHTPAQPLEPVAVQHSVADLMPPIEHRPTQQLAPFSTLTANTAAEAPKLAPMEPSPARQYDPLPNIEVVPNRNSEPLAPIEHNVGNPEPLQAISNSQTAPDPLTVVQLSEHTAPEALPRVEANHQAPELLAPLVAAPAATPEPLQVPPEQYTSSATPLPALEPHPAAPPPALPPLETTQSKQDEVDVEALLSSVQPREERSFFKLSGVPLLSEM